MDCDVSNVCFVGVYGHNQDDVLRRGLADQNITLTEVAVPKASVSEALSERKLPMYTMRATIRWLRRFPSWLFPILFFITLTVHTLSIWFVMARRHKDIRKADVFVVPHMGDTSLFAVKPVASWLGTPTMYFSHNGLYYPLVENQQIFTSESAAARILFYTDWTLHRLADKVFVFSTESKHRFADTYDADLDTYEVLYITAIESNFDKAINPDPSLDCDVLYWGNFHSHHGPKTMVKAAKSLPSREFVFIGESEKRKRVVNEAERLKVENIEFKGFVRLDLLVQYIKSADVVLGPVGDNPQTEFTIGTKVAEAAYLEKAIIVGRQPGVEEVFVHEESAFLVDPGNPEAVADGVEKILSRVQLKRHLERESYEVYKNHFSTASTTERFLSVANGLVSE